MVFATDAFPGNKIMSSIYRATRAKGIPEQRSQAVANRQARRREARGLLTLFDPGAPKVKSWEYKHFSPWKPPIKLPETVVFDEPSESNDSEDEEVWPSPDGS